MLQQAGLFTGAAAFNKKIADRDQEKIPLM
jgi:hypothetical protein